MLLFGDVGHGHSHGGEDKPKPADGGHGHSHGEKKGHGNGHAAENGHSHKADNGHGHSHAPKKTKGHGHSHGDTASGHSMNISGVFLHVLADALGSVVVCITSLVIMFTEWEYKYYLDPVLSLIIVIIILVSTWPLLRDSTLILLNTIPSHIDLLDLETRLVAKVAGVASIHELHVWRLVGKRVVASCHLEVSLNTACFYLTVGSPYLLYLKGNLIEMYIFQMTPPPLGLEPVDHHMAVAREVKS